MIRSVAILSIALGFIGAASTPAAFARGDRTRQQEDARLAVGRSEALPLAEILARVRGDLKGEIVGFEFERQRGRWIYEFRIIGTDGQLVEVPVDAASAEILGREDQ